MSSFSNNSQQVPRHHRRVGRDQSQQPTMQNYEGNPLNHYYYYPNTHYGLYVPHDISIYPVHGWVNSQIQVQHTMLPYIDYVETTPTPEPAQLVRLGSNFSPEAPEFVMKDAKGAVEQISVKKKRRKKKKKTTTENSRTDEILCTDESKDIPEATLNNLDLQVVDEPLSKPASKSNKVVRFLEKEKELLNDEVTDVEKQIPHPALNYSNLFLAQKKVPKENWPQLNENFNEEASSPANEESNVKRGTTFADKLKNPPSKKCNKPFLDWRDQRTNASNQPPSDPPEESNDWTENTEGIANPKTENKEKVEDLSIEEEWTEVRRKKREKIIETETTVEKEVTPVSSGSVSGSIRENIAPKDQTEKEKARKEKKKLREKEKKKQLRDERLLAEKLAPKGQKVTLITPKIMEKFLQSTTARSAKSSQSTPAAAAKTNAFDNLFPALSRTARISKPDSESEWETTEVEVVRARESPTDNQPNQSKDSNQSSHAQFSAVTKNVKRSDPIEWDLMTLIKLKAKPKTSAAHQQKQDAAKRRQRAMKSAGVVANPLDRNAPILARGKIRSKKRKLSDIRKALVAAKAKKKELLENAVSATEQVDSDVSKTAKNSPPPPKLHSNKFREYCDQMLTDDIDVNARDMLFHLRHFQDRAFQKDPIKGRMRKRLIAGLREVTKQVERNRVKMIFLAPDIQRCPETGGLDEAVLYLLELARKGNLPVVYALSRRKIGRVLKKNVPVSCCGILNHQGTEETWRKLSELVARAKEEYQAKALFFYEKSIVSDATEVEASAESPEEILSSPVRVEPKSTQLPETNVLLELIRSS